MPIYEYTCSACDTRFEQLVRSPRDERGLACPDCGEKKVQRALSVFAARAAAEKPAAGPGPCGGCSEANGSCPYAP